MKVRLAGVALTAVLVLGACTEGGGGAQGDGGEQAETLRIGMANFTLCCAYFIGMDEAARQEAEAFGNVEVISTDANGDAAKLTSDIEDLLAQGIDGLIISAGPLEAAPAALEAADQAGVPVVMVDRKLTGGPYTSWIGPDNEAIGRQDGEYIADRLEGEGKLVVISGGPADNTIGLARTNGMLSVVEETDIEVVRAPQFGEWSEDGGLAVMEDLLAAHDDIDAVFCENDSMCLGARKAIADAGRAEQIFLAGVDGQKEALAAIQEGGNYAVTGLNNAVEMGNAAYERLSELLDGKKAEKDTVLPSPLITRENVESYYDPDSVF
jgi:ribose transport system substrate-binding protein